MKIKNNKIPALISEEHRRVYSVYYRYHSQIDFDLEFLNIKKIY